MAEEKRARKNAPLSLLTHVIPDLATVALHGDVVLGQVAPRYKFEDGHYTDTVEGQTYTVILTGNVFQRLDIRTDEQTPVLSPEDLNELVQSGETVIITAALADTLTYTLKSKEAGK